MASGRWSNPFERKDKNAPPFAPAAGLTKPAHESLPNGLKVLAEGADPVLDIVAVHGLHGHHEKTWTANNVNCNINWLRDFLPSDIPNARILTWFSDLAVAE